MRLNAKQIAEACGGQFLVDPIEASDLLYGITWDSREVQPGWLYVALPGEHVDGHEFVSAALRAGARAVLVTDHPDEPTMLLACEMGASIIEVSDTMHAITDIARAWREHLHAHVIGITGSSGKTTTKNLIRDVVATTYNVVATLANQNNELGVPRTILAADPDTEVVIVEMGMRGLGQISELADFVCPDWGLITNIGEGHLELLDSRENIARAKSELFAALPAGTGRAFVNVDDDFTDFVVDQACLSDRDVACIGFSGADAADAAGSADAAASEAADEADAADAASEADAAGAASEAAPTAAAPTAAESTAAAPGNLQLVARVWAEDVTLNGEGQACFRLCATGFPLHTEHFSHNSSESEEIAAGEDHTQESPDAFDPSNTAVAAAADTQIERVTCTLALRGLHNVANACAAAACARALGIELSVIASALAVSVPESGRQEIVKARGGFTVINDAYNANPDSMRASLSMFSSFDVPGRRFAVLGDMGELGNFSEACHRGIGRAMTSYDIDCLLCVGQLAALIAEDALAAGMSETEVMTLDTVADVLEVLDSRLEPGDAVLVKASHFMGLDRVVEGLVN